MTKNAQRARPGRYTAASIAQYLHELSGRHADERSRAVEKPMAMKPAPRVSLAAR